MSRSPAAPDELLTKLEAEATELADEIRPNIAPATTGGRDIMRRMSSYRTAAVSALVNRWRLRRGDECLRPTFFIWTMTNKCNFACAYCDNHRGEMYPDLPDTGRLNTDDGKRLLRIMRTGTSALYFCGGEPTLRNDLPELAREAWGLDYFPLIINTNASLLHRRLQTETWSDWLAHMDIVICSLDSLDPRKLDDLYVTSDGEDVIRNVLLLAKLREHTGIKLVVNTVIQPGMIESASAVLDFARRHDIWFVPVPVNHGPSADGDLLSDPEYQRLAQRILDRKRDGQRIVGTPKLLDKLLYQKPLHCHPTLKPHIDPDGSLLWPCKPCVNMEPIRLNVLDYDSLDAVWQAGKDKTDPTGFHGYAPDQCGANCGWAQNYAGDFYAEGLLHPIRSGLLEQVREFTSL